MILLLSILELERQIRGWVRVERWRRSETGLVWVCFFSLRAFAWGFPVIVERQTFEGFRCRCKHAILLSLWLWSRLGLGLRMTGCMVSVYSMALLSYFLSFSLPFYRMVSLPSLIHSFSSVFFLCLSYQTCVSVTAVVTAAQALFKCPNKDRFTNILWLHSRCVFIYLCVCSSLVINNKSQSSCH